MIHRAAEAACDDKPLNILWLHAFLIQKCQQAAADGGFCQLNLANILLRDGNTAGANCPVLGIFVLRL